jgi:hypothetical protein
MSDSIVRKIDTTKYTTEGKVEVDGNVWTVKLPGAGTELQLSKNKRRQDFIGKKIEKGTATEEDLDRFDEIEQFFYDFFRNLFQDGTESNSAVHEWVDSTPMAVILQAFEDIKEQANKKED